MKHFLSISAILFVVASISASTIWNISDATMFPATIVADTTIGDLTFKANNSSSSHTLVISDNVVTWTADDASESFDFTRRMKFDGGGNADYRHVLYNAMPGDTIEVWAQTSSSSGSERTITFYEGKYNGTSLGSFKAGANVTRGVFVYNAQMASTIAIAASSGWYLYAVRASHNPNYVYVKPILHWYLKHPWGTGQNSGWEWRELLPNADSTIYSREDLYGGTGCNYSNNADGSSSSWVSDPTLVGEPAVGDSCLFAIDPSTKKITITKLSGSAPVPAITTWYLKHPWGGGEWTWKELTPNADSTIWSIREVFGGNGCNYSSSADGNAWISENELTKIGDPSVGDSCIFRFDPATVAIDVEKIVVEETALETVSSARTQKAWMNGTLYIYRDGCRYDVFGRKSDKK